MLLCRSLERGEKAAQEIREATKGEVTVFRLIEAKIQEITVTAWNFEIPTNRLDLSSLSSVKECCSQISRNFSKVEIQRCILTLIS